MWRVRQSRLVSRREVVKRTLRGIFHKVPTKRLRIYRVDYGNVSLKRIVFKEVRSAVETGRRLRTFRGERLFPEFVGQHGTDLWAEFIHGQTVSEATPTTLAELARIYGTLYARNPVCRPIDSDTWLQDVRYDLGFLHETGVLSERLYCLLCQRLIEWAPDQVWVGWDYSDPRLANLVALPDGSLRIIDIESIREQCLLGTGVAKACFRQLGDRREAFLALLRGQQGPPPIWDAFLFVELHALCSWTRNAVLLRKRKLVRPHLFETLASRS